jgi:hypothetical protein
LEALRVARSKRSGGKKSSGGSKGKYRSAVSGRYVTAAHARRAPKTTVRESPSARARRIKGKLREQGRHFDDSTEIIRRDRESR